MAYLVKALGACKAPIKHDVDVLWAPNEIREVDDALYSYYRNRSVAFTVLAGPGATANLSAALTAADIPVGEGAATFTQLTDAPASITANAVLAGNDAGTGLFMSEAFVVAENGVVQVMEDGDNGVHIHAHGSGGLLLSAGGSGGLVIGGNGEGGVTISSIGATAAGVNIATGTEGDGIMLNPGNLGKLQIDGNITVQSQSVVIAGVGTLVFKHGLLITFTPEA